MLTCQESGERPSEEACTTWPTCGEALRENSPRDVGIKMPPVYAEAVALSRNLASNGRSPAMVKGHIKQRWKTVAGVSAPLDFSNTDRYQQFRYFQTGARSEPESDLQVINILEYVCPRGSFLNHDGKIYCIINEFFWTFLENFCKIKSF